MPVTLRQNKIQIKDDNGIYHSIDAFTDGSIEERLSKIDAKTQQALASISDVAELENMIANVFDTTKTYQTGNYVIKETNGSNKLYVFRQSHPAGPWIETDAAEVVIGNDITELKNTIDNLIQRLEYVEQYIDNYA